MTTWPTDLTTKQVTFDIRAAGSIRFVGPVLTVGTDNAVTVRVDETAVTTDGTGTITLPATDAAAAVPSGWEYDVTIHRGGRVDRGTMTLLSAASAPVTLASVLSLDQNAPAAGTTYIPLSQKGAASGVASLGSDGKVPAGQLPSSSGGSIASTDITDSTATGRAVLTAASAAAARTAIGAGTGSSEIDATFPVSHWGLVAASDNPIAFYNPSQVSAQDWYTRVWIPAGKAVTGLYLAIATAGTHDGVTTGNGLALYDDSGTLVDTIAYADSLWATVGWRGGNLLAGAIAAQASGRWVYLGAKVRGYAANAPAFAYATGANDRTYHYTGPATTKRRTFYQAAAATFPATIDPTATGTATGYNFLVGAV
jgi:hypothetical protein